MACKIRTSCCVRCGILAEAMTHLPEIVSWLDANPEAAAAAPRHVAIVVRGVRQGRLRAMGLEILRRELPGIDGKATGIDAGARSRSTHDPGKAIGKGGEGGKS